MFKSLKIDSSKGVPILRINRVCGAVTSTRQTQPITGNVLNFQTLYSILFWPNFFFVCRFFLKILSGMANSVEPDQTSPSGLHSLHNIMPCMHMPFCQKLW